MTGIIDLYGIGTVAFVTTNIDDLFILTVFFAKSDFSHTQVILGQYVGMGLLIGVSLLASLVVLIIPQSLIGLIGLVPIVIGLKELLDLLRDGQDYDDGNQQIIKRISSSNRWTVYLPFLTVATITYSGGEEIGIFTSIFVIINDLQDIIVIITTVMVLTGVWCAMSFYLVNHTLQATRFRRVADRALPFVLIALGVYILVDAFLI